MIWSSVQNHYSKFAKVANELVIRIIKMVQVKFSVHGLKQSYAIPP